MLPVKKGYKIIARTYEKCSDDKYDYNSPQSLKSGTIATRKRNDITVV